MMKMPHLSCFEYPARISQIYCPKMCLSTCTRVTVCISCHVTYQALFLNMIFTWEKVSLTALTTCPAEFSISEINHPHSRCPLLYGAIKKYQIIVLTQMSVSFLTISTLATWQQCLEVNTNLQILLHLLNMREQHRKHCSALTTMQHKIQYKTR